MLTTKRRPAKAGKRPPAPWPTPAVRHHDDHSGWHDGVMLWPVLLNTHPRDAMWSLGERVTTWLRWLDDPKLLDQLVRHQVVVRASTLLDVDGRLLAQLIEAATARWQRRPAVSGSPQPGCGP
jgi:hypothetical protein